MAGKPHTSSSTITLPLPAFAALLAVCMLLTTASTATLATLAYRAWRQRQQRQAAKAWGRKSRYAHRISQLCKEVDDEYRVKFTGCLAGTPENPEMGSDSPIELMPPEERVWEVSAEPASSATFITDDAAGAGGYKAPRRKSAALSLFFDHAVGLWMPKR